MNNHKAEKKMGLGIGSAQTRTHDLTMRKIKIYLAQINAEQRGKKERKITK